jgi:hypothetical protein
MKKLPIFLVIGAFAFIASLSSSCKKTVFVHDTVVNTVIHRDTVVVPPPPTVYNIPMDTLHWTLVQFTSLTNASYFPTDPSKFFKTDSSVVGYCSSSRQEYGLVSAQTYDLNNRTVYIKWRSTGSGQFSTVHIFVSRDGLIVPDNQTSNLPARLPYYMTNLSSPVTFNASTVISEDTWYYTRIGVSESAYSSVTATGNYDDAGGTVVETKNGPMLNSAIGTIGIYDLDPYAGPGCHKEIREAIVK